jgi:hypothetical protein
MRAQEKCNFCQKRGRVVQRHSFYQSFLSRPFGQLTALPVSPDAPRQPANSLGLGSNPAPPLWLAVLPLRSRLSMKEKNCSQIGLTKIVAL